jgi:uncharacterized membrane protein
MAVTDRTLSRTGSTMGAGHTYPTAAFAARRSSWETADNVSGGERLVSLAAGSILALLGVGRRDLTGLVVAGVGAGLIYRGATGHCSVYESMGIDTAHKNPANRFHPPAARPRPSEKRAVHIAQSLLIDKSPEELYGYWRDFQNLPRIMTHLESVQLLDERRSHWVAKAPSIAGGKVEWDAEMTIDEPNVRIAWQSLPGADVDNRGSVQFTRALGDRGTKVRVVVDYAPPAGRLGKSVAKLFGEEPEQQIWNDLRNFKRMMEVGEILTVEGQPCGTCTG